MERRLKGHEDRDGHTRPEAARGDLRGPRRHLIRKVVPQRGEPYEHRCPRRTFEQVAWAIDEASEGTFTLQSLVQAEDLPFSQVAVTLAFLKERGIIATRYRRNYAATPSAHLDAMTEFYALAEKG